SAHRAAVASDGAHGTVPGNHGARRIEQRALQRRRLPHDADLAEVRRAVRTTPVDAMTRAASALAGEERLAPAGIADLDGRPRGVEARTDVGDERGHLVGP